MTCLVWYWAASRKIMHNFDMFMQTALLGKVFDL